MNEENPKYITLGFRSGILLESGAKCGEYVHDAYSHKVNTMEDSRQYSIDETVNYFAQKEHGGYRVVTAFSVNKAGGEEADEVIVIMERQ